MFNDMSQVANDFSDLIHNKPENCRVIVSSHNFNNTPSSESIGNLVARIQATGADIVKIATTGLDITDCARIFRIMVHSQASIWIFYLNQFCSLTYLYNSLNFADSDYRCCNGRKGFDFTDTES